MVEIIDVEKLKSQLSGRESTLLAYNKLASKLDGSCATQAPEWEQRQRVRAEELVTIQDTTKLLNDNDSLELFKETLLSPILMQLQSNKRGVACRARAVVRNSSGSPGQEMVSLFHQKQTDGDHKKTYCSTSVDRKGEDKFLSIDIKSLESATADPIERLTGTEERLMSVSAAQHRSNRSTQQRRQWQQPRKEQEEGKEEKCREEREKGRKGQRGRGQEGRKEEEREAEEEGDKQVKKDVTDWTEVTRNKRQKKMIQIFVKVNGSKVTPMEVSLTDDKVADVMRRIQKDEDAYVTRQGKVLRTREKLKSCGVTDGCTIQVMSRMRGGGKHKDKTKTSEKEHTASAKENEQKSVEEPKTTKVQR